LADGRIRRILAPERLPDQPLEIGQCPFTLPRGVGLSRRGSRRAATGAVYATDSLNTFKALKCNAHAVRARPAWIPADRSQRGRIADMAIAQGPPAM